MGQECSHDCSSCDKNCASKIIKEKQNEKSKIKKVIGVVSGKFKSEFTSVGINMTKHSLLLDINVHVNIVLPVKSYDINSTNQVLLAESIIVGKVPEFYLNGKSGITSF